MAGLFCPTAPGADVEAPRIQNEGGFDRRGTAATAGGPVNSQNGRQAQNLPVAKGANNPILLDQEIRGILDRALAGQICPGFHAADGPGHCPAYSSRQLNCLLDGGIRAINFMETATITLRRSTVTTAPDIPKNHNNDGVTIVLPVSRLIIAGHFLFVSRSKTRSTSSSLLPETALSLDIDRPFVNKSLHFVNNFPKVVNNFSNGE